MTDENETLNLAANLRSGFSRAREGMTDLNGPQPRVDADEEDAQAGGEDGPEVLGLRVVQNSLPFIVRCSSPASTGASPR